jgi:hypothetical protein
MRWEWERRYTKVVWPDLGWRIWRHGVRRLFRGMRPHHPWDSSSFLERNQERRLARIGALASPAARNRCYLSLGGWFRFSARHFSPR